jgi:ankyrin repeat protein
MAYVDLIQATKPLYFAASYGLVSVVQLILTDVAALDLEAKGGRYGSSALQVASYRGNTECVRLLLAAGADPNSTNYLNETSLYWAGHIGSAEIVDLLRSKGATK